MPKISGTGTSVAGREPTALRAIPGSAVDRNRQASSADTRKRLNAAFGGD